MNLFELLSAMKPKDFVIIVDYESRNADNRTKRMKVGNISMEKLRNIGGRDVYTISYSEEQHCFVVCVGDKRGTKTQLSMWHVIDTRLKQLGLIQDGGIVKVK